MNEIAASSGRSGSRPRSPSSPPSDWDVVIVGGGHNGLTAAAYLASAGQSVLVLERARAARRRLHARAAVPDQRYSVSPCAYVVGLLDELVIDELQLEQRGFEFYVADPNLWVPFEDGTSFGQWLDDDQDPGGTCEELGVSKPRTSTATGPTSTSSTRSASACATAGATRGSATRRPAPRSRSCCAASRR